MSQFEEFQQFKERSRASQSSRSNARVEEGSRSRHRDSRRDHAPRHQQIDTALARDLLDRVGSAPPEFFELIVNLLISMGYGGSRADQAGRTLGRSGDDGVDGVIGPDALGAFTFRPRDMPPEAILAPVQYVASR